MTYQEFLERFGRSVRTKNIIQPGEADPKKLQENKRPHALPDTSKIPLEFIRLDPWEAEYLFIIAQRAHEGIVETGRFFGGSTFVMACANPDVPIHSIDIRPKNDERLRRILDRHKIGSNINLLVGDSTKREYPGIGKFDVLFVDGDHSYEGCMKDIQTWYPLLSPGGHVVLHDSYYGQPVMDAVADFCASEAVDVVIPAYRSHAHWWHPAGSMAHFRKPMR